MHAYAEERLVLVSSVEDDVVARGLIGRVVRCLENQLCDRVEERGGAEAWRVEVGDGVFCGVEQEHELGADEGREDEVLEKLDGPEHALEDSTLEPVELLQRVQRDHGPGALVRRERHGVQEREVL